MAVLTPREYQVQLNRVAAEEATNKPIRVRCVDPVVQNTDAPSVVSLGRQIETGQPGPTALTNTPASKSSLIQNQRTSAAPGGTVRIKPANA